MDRTVRTIIDLLHTQANQWYGFAAKYQEIINLLGDDISSVTKESHRSTILTYRTCAMDLDVLADEIANRPLKKGKTDEPIVPRAQCEEALHKIRERIHTLEMHIDRLSKRLTAIAALPPGGDAELEKQAREWMQNSESDF
jgi:hypothetical protein